jgi:uncharacterized protein
VQRRDSEFEEDGGSILRRWPFVPEGPGPHSAITMAHGNGGAKEQRLEAFAVAFAEDGSPSAPPVPTRCTSQASG